MSWLDVKVPSPLENWKYSYTSVAPETYFIAKTCNENTFEPTVDAILKPCCVWASILLLDLVKIQLIGTITCVLNKSVKEVPSAEVASGSKFVLKIVPILSANSLEFTISYTEV